MRSSSVHSIVLTLSLGLATSDAALAQDKANVPGGLPALAERVADLERVPVRLPVPLGLTEGLGNGTGCDLEGIGAIERLFRARCNENNDPTTPKSGLRVSLMVAADPQYAYDGLYLCGLVNDELADRRDVMTLNVSFREIITADDGSLLLQRGDTSSLIFLIELDDLRPRVDAITGQRACLTLPFAAAVQSGEGSRLPGDIWLPNAQMSLVFTLPTMLPFAPPTNQGDGFTLSQIGLTVAGRRPAGQ